MTNKMKNQIKEFEKNVLYYEAARKQLDTYITTIYREFEVIENYNPINHIKTRIKTFESIVGKLKRKNKSISKENIEQLTDIVGARIIVDFVDNIYEIISKIKDNKNIKIIEEKDYIKSPKVSGYRGYHLIISMPISISGNTKDIYCEIQVRTTAMDFWATNEHKLNYKSKNQSLDYSEKWQDAAKKVWELDLSMNELYLENKEQESKSKDDISFSVLKSIDKINSLKKIGESYGR